MSFSDPSLPSRGRARAESGQVSRGRAGKEAGNDPVSRSYDANAGDQGDSPRIDKPRGSPYRRSADWERIALVGAGLLVGALVGAGAALLLAPQSGQETRKTIRRKARVARHRATDAWDDLAGELAALARRKGRRARLAMRRARWRASDAIA
jgi:hypothetical protein